MLEYFYSPDGKSLVFLSAKSAVDTGAHSATNSLHRIDWPSDGKPHLSVELVDVVSSLFLCINFILFNSLGLQEIFADACTSTYPFLELIRGEMQLRTKNFS